MVLGEAAAIASFYALSDQVPVQDIDIKTLQKRLKNDPLLDGTPPDIIVDNSFTDKVEIIGKWATISSWMGQYMSDYLLSDPSANGRKRIIFSPFITTPGIYHIYFFCPSKYSQPENNNWPSAIPVKIIYNEKEVIKVINPEVNEFNWADLGKYKLGSGETCKIEVIGDTVSLPVPADAVLLVPGHK